MFAGTLSILTASSPDARRPKCLGRLRRVAAMGGQAMAVAILAFALAPPASAQTGDLRPMIDRIERLERDIRTLNLQLAGKPPAAGQAGGAAGGFSQPLASGGTDPAYASLSVRLTELEEQLRRLTGQIEQARHVSDTNQTRMDKLVSDVDFRLIQLESKLNPAGEQPAASGAQPQADGNALPTVSGAPQQAAPDGTRIIGTVSQNELERGRTAAGQAAGGAAGARPQGAPPQAGAATVAQAGPALPPGTSKEQYDHIWGLLQQSRYDAAERSLTAFLEAHPTDPLADNARYWLGETHYARNDFVKAAEVFLKGYQAAPKGAKAADSLLKLGMSLNGLGKKAEACATYGRLRQDFPRLSEPLTQSLARERTRAGC